jgi:hypothetical protein
MIFLRFQPMEGRPRRWVPSKTRSFRQRLRRRQAHRLSESGRRAVQHLAHGCRLRKPRSTYPRKGGVVSYLFTRWPVGHLLCECGVGNWIDLHQRGHSANAEIPGGFLGSGSSFGRLQAVSPAGFRSKQHAGSHSHPGCSRSRGSAPEFFRKNTGHDWGALGSRLSGDRHRHNAQRRFQFLAPVASDRFAETTGLAAAWTGDGKTLVMSRGMNSADIVLLKAGKNSQ